MEKNKAAQELGAKGGKTAAQNMSKEERTERARTAALARWKKENGEPTYVQTEESS